MSKKQCQYCGAPFKPNSKIQGYNFVCEYCGNLTPVDNQTRAAIDTAKNARQQQIEMAQQQENYRRSQKQEKKNCLVAIITFVGIMAVTAGISIISKCVASHESTKEQEKILAIQQDIMSSNPQSVYVAPSDIFIVNETGQIGHLNQNLVTTLKQKGYVEDGVLTYSYYTDGKPTDKKNRNKFPLIKVEINSYRPLGSYSERLNETDAVHSVGIVIKDKDVKKAYENSFKKDLRNIGFKAMIDNTNDYVASSDMSSFNLIRIGETKTKTIYASEYYTYAKTIANWEGVDFDSTFSSSIDCSIMCVAFREF